MLFTTFTIELRSSTDVVVRGRTSVVFPRQWRSAVSDPLVVAPLTRLIDQPRVDRYAEAAHDPNPIHRDTPQAAASQFGRPIAHGMLVLALVSEAMAAAFGERWAAGGSLRIRFRAPALPPITVTARAEAALGRRRRRHLRRRVRRRRWRDAALRDRLGAVRVVFTREG